MTVMCDLEQCRYNTSGICCQENYVIIEQGYCKWLINNPNFASSTQPTTKEEEKT